MTGTMFKTIRVKRGLKANLPSDLKLGELAYCIDVNELWIGTPSGNKLVNESEFISIDEKGKPLGVPVLDAYGKVPASMISANAKAINVVNTIADRDALVGMSEGQKVHVLDASADPNVDSGWAEYIVLADGSYSKVAEHESLDVVLDWSNILNKPDKFPPEEHYHDTRYLRRDTSDTMDGVLTINPENQTYTGTRSTSKLYLYGQDSICSIVSNSDATYGSVIGLEEVDKNTGNFLSTWDIYRNTSEASSGMTNALNFVFGTSTGTSTNYNNNGSCPQMRLLPEGMQELYRKTNGDVLRLIANPSDTDVSMAIGHKSSLPDGDVIGYRFTYHGTGTGNENDFSLSAKNYTGVKEIFRSHLDGIVDFKQGLKLKGSTVLTEQSNQKHIASVQGSYGTVADGASFDGAPMWVRCAVISADGTYRNQQVVLAVHDRAGLSFVSIHGYTGSSPIKDTASERLKLIQWDTSDYGRGIYRDRIKLLRKFDTSTSTVSWELWVRTTTWGSVGTSIVSSFGHSNVLHLNDGDISSVLEELPTVGTDGYESVLVANDNMYSAGYRHLTTEDLGDWSISSNSLKVNNKRAMVGYGTSDGNMLVINEGTDFSNGVVIKSKLQVIGDVPLTGSIVDKDHTSTFIDLSNTSNNMHIKKDTGNLHIDVTGTQVFRDINGVTRLEIGDEIKSEKKLVANSGLSIRNGIILDDNVSTHFKYLKAWQRSEADDVTFRWYGDNNLSMGDVMRFHANSSGTVGTSLFGTNALSLRTTSSDHVYMQFFTRSDGASDNGTRSGYIGYPTTGTNVMTFHNEIGNVKIVAPNVIVDRVLKVEGAETTIGGTTIANAWLKIGDTLGIDNNEVMCAEDLYVGTVNARKLSLKTNNLERVIVHGNQGLVQVSAKLQVGDTTNNDPSPVAVMGAAGEGSDISALSLVNSSPSCNDNAVSLNFHNTSVWSSTGKIKTAQKGSSTSSDMHFMVYDGGLKDTMIIRDNGDLEVTRGSLKVRGWTLEQDSSSGSLKFRF